MDAQPNSQPGPDTIARVITHWDAELPQWHVVIQMRSGDLVLFGKFITHDRARFERLALEGMLFEGKTTKPPASFNAG